VLAAGSDAVLSHRSAAALWGIRETARTAVDVTCPRKLRRPGIRSRCAVLLADEVTRERGIPVTTPARTLFDLAELLTAQQLERALDEAEIRRLATPLPLDALIARHPGRRGIATLRRALDKQRKIGETVTRSELEERFLAFLDAHELPRPRMNAPLGPYEPDAVWRGAGVIVELDGYATHATRRAFEADRARDRAFQVAGWRVVRITWRQLRDEPRAIAAQLRALLRDTVCAP
jgi:very-short-patch-repair endonuclease